MLDIYKVPFARNFTAASSQYLEVASAPLSAPPFTMACWFNTRALATAQTLMGLFNSGNDIEYFRLTIGETSGTLDAEARGGGIGPAESNKSTFATNTWHHAVGVYASSSSRTAYLDGSAGTAETTAITVTVNKAGVGRLGRPSATQYMDGQIIWPCFWNIALDASDIQRLARGASPQTVKPESIVAFWDWTGAEMEFGSKPAYALTNTGSWPVTGTFPYTTRIGRRAQPKKPASAAGGAATAGQLTLLGCGA